MGLRKPAVFLQTQEKKVQDCCSHQSGWSQSRRQGQRDQCHVDFQKTAAFRGTGGCTQPGGHFGSSQHVQRAQEKLLLIQGQSTASCCCVLIEEAGGEALGAQSCRDRSRSLTTAMQTPAGGLWTVPAASCSEGFSGSAAVRSAGGGLRGSLGTHVG